MLPWLAYILPLRVLHARDLSVGRAERHYLPVFYTRLRSKLLDLIFLICMVDQTLGA